ncbi:alpha/beta hydrolase [Methylobacterium dankookense]|uniref:Monoterpene epsilon-lactone hydrolase n=1 Tax=Methylobacterium dankookense TaxID=560405 RepID=A0A564G1W1_9HYPH|nr:alpha/beta hydrolase [Methylobacterium dankookense]GJD54692.1 Monoterpene epsilon-lactone hydrolase [Methylobacterium dankookense]VUF14415.1 Monoterpene epsilon-lactone hydrolase [Methylobacterium dankookense]
MPASDIDQIRARLAAHPRPADLAARRARVDALGAGYGLPPDVTVEPVDAGGVPAEWTRIPGSEDGPVILFLHGGGYVSGSLASHRHTVAQAGREAGARTLALAYRLAPEHPAPAALADALAGYRFLLETGVAPRRIALSGESAGGGLALAVALSLREAGLPLPGCLWLSSPWTDLALTGASLETKAGADPLISRAYLAELAGLYLAGADPRGPLVSPLYANLAGLPPMLIQVGSAETLLDDSVRLAGVAGAADVSVRLEVWPHMIHAWHLFFPEVEDGRRSLASAGRFVRAECAG